MRAFAFALALIATPAAATEQQFDLTCEGEEQLRPTAKWKPISVRFKIDTAAMVWCQDECIRLLPLASVDAGRIVLSTSGPGLGVPYVSRIVDRVSGSYSSYWDGERQRATCASAAFSGFPAAKL